MPSRLHRRKKAKKLSPSAFPGGDVAITAAANGLDVVLEIAETPELNHRMIIFEMISGCDDIIRISWRLRPVN